MTPLRITVVLFITFVSFASAFSDEAFDIFVEACRHSGYNPAEIATFQAELKVVTQVIYPDSIVEHRKQEMDREGANLGWNEDEKQRSRQANEANFKEMYSGDSSVRHVKVSLVNSAAPLGLEETLVQFIEEDIGDRKSAHLTQTGSQIRTPSVDGITTVVGTEARVGVMQFGDSTMVMPASYRQGGNYHFGGRATSIMTSWALETLLVRDDNGSFVVSNASITEWKKVCEKYEITFTLSKEKAKYERDHSAYIVEIYEKGQLWEQLWIDPDRGYICPKIKCFDPTDRTIKSDVVATNFILDEYSQKWFPQKVTHSAWMGKEPDIIASYSEVYLMQGTLVLNRPVPGSVFALTIQKGNRVDDVRRDDNDKITFIANEPGKLDLLAVDKKSLDDLSWLTKQETRQPRESYPLEKATFSWTGIVLMAVGVIMIVLGLILYFFKK